MAKLGPKIESLEMQEWRNCQVLEVGIDGYAECLRTGPNSCAYALPFGYSFLCHHPRLNQIAEHSRTDVTVRAKAN
jgi:hypothetical protein